MTESASIFNRPQQKLTAVLRRLWPHLRKFAPLAIMVIGYLLITHANFMRIAPNHEVYARSGAGSILLLAQAIGVVMICCAYISAGMLIRSFHNRRVGWSALALTVAVFVLFRTALAAVSYPGILSPDLEHMLHMVSTFEIYDKYSYISTLILAAGLGLTGSIYGIVIFDAILHFMAIVCAISFAVRCKLNVILVAGVIGLFLLLPAALFFAVFPGRDATFLHFFNIALLAAALRKIDHNTNWSLHNELGLGLILALPLLARPEAIVMAPAFLVAICMAAKSLRSKTLISIAFLALTLCANPLLRMASEGLRPEVAHSATAVLNPLHEIVYLAGADGALLSQGMRPRGELSEPLSKVGRVMNLERAQSAYDSGNIAIWFDPEGMLRDASDEDWAEFRQGALQLIVQNPHIFAANRARVWVETNGVTPTLLFPHLRTSAAIESSPLFTRFMDPAPTEGQVSRSLALAQWVGVFSGFRTSPTWIIWTMVPGLILSIGLLLTWRAAPLAAILSAANLVRCFAVFLTAPATFTTYYSTLYISVWILLLIAIGEAALRGRGRAPSAHKRATCATVRGGSLVSAAVFAMFGGFGWIVDFSLFTLLVSELSVGAGLANFVSSMVGALLAFSGYAMTRWGGGNRPTAVQLAAYAVYQVAAIASFSAAISVITRFFDAGGLSITLWVSGAIAAKILVTPANLALNYLASRLILKNGQARGSSVAMSSDNTNPTQSRILVFVPAYNCEAQIGRVISQLEGRASDWVDTLLVVDNRSTDDTSGAARQAAMNLSIPWVIWRNANNYGLGGSHKVAMQYAISNKFDYLVVLHGDDQACIDDLDESVRTGSAFAADCFLGARFAPGSELQGYSWFRTFGNQVYNLLFSAVCRQRIYDLGSGLNVYRVAALNFQNIKLLPDDLTFNYSMLMLSLHEKRKVKFFPITWREEDQSSNVRLFRQSMRVLSLLAQRAWNPQAFFECDQRSVKHIEYTGTEEFSSSSIEK